MFGGDEDHEKIFKAGLGSFEAGVETCLGKGEERRGRGAILFVEFADEACYGVGRGEGSAAGRGGGCWARRRMRGEAREEAGEEGEVGEESREYSIRKVEGAEKEGEEGRSAVGCR